MADPVPARTTPVALLKLATLARLSAPDAGDISLLLASGETVRLNRMAARILGLCDGTRTADQIATECAENADATREFLSAALELGWLLAHPGGPRR